MCRYYNIVYWCGHVKNDSRVCRRDERNCNNISRDNVISILSHCPDCIEDPKFPTSEQQTVIPIPELDRLIEAELIWTRWRTLFYDSGSGMYEPDKPHPHYRARVPEQDLNRLYYWLQLLQESKRTRESWIRHTTGGHRNELDKDLYLEVLKSIVFNEIHTREVGATALNQGNEQNLLTKVDIEDLEEDNRDCPICHEPYGEAPVAGEVPEITVRLPCGHVFGEVCIISAFERVGWSCPYCRAPYDQAQFVLNRSPEVIPSPWWMEWLKRPAE